KTRTRAFGLSSLVRPHALSNPWRSFSIDYARFSLLQAGRRANYNMHILGKTINELHAMLKLHGPKTTLLLFMLFEQGEYMSQEFFDHLKGHGIIAHRTPPYTPQHNEMSKRRNRTLLDMVRSMMSQTTLLKSFWDYAPETDAGILNMVPTKKVEKTPYEVWHWQAPKLSYLKVWGCEALVKRDTLTKPDKLEPRSIKCIFIGYPKEIIGYSFYFPPENKVLIVRNTEFLENSLITQEASGRLKDLEIIQKEDTHPSIDTSLNHKEDDQKIDEPQSDINPIHRSTRTRRPTYRMDYKETFSPVRYHMENSKHRSIPMQEKLRLSKSQGALTPVELKRMKNVPYASAVGSIMYTVRCTRPDVAFAQNITSRFQHTRKRRTSDDIFPGTNVAGESAVNDKKQSDEALLLVPENSLEVLKVMENNLKSLKVLENNLKSLKSRVLAAETEPRGENEPRLSLHQTAESTTEVDVEAPPDIIDVDEDDDFFNDEDNLPHDLADFDDEVLANDDDADVAVVYSNVSRRARGHGGGDDRPPSRPIGTSCQGRRGRGGRKPNWLSMAADGLGTHGETKNLGLRKTIDYWLDPKNTARALQNAQNQAKRKVFCRQGSRSLAVLRDQQDEMIQLRDLGANTLTGVPYTKEQTTDMVRKGKQLGHIPGIGRVLDGHGRDAISINEP
nr:retrotransposon protein, putative, Ty1-copia subclass [Tanacetum cinerariifolium]